MYLGFLSKLLSKGSSLTSLQVGFPTSFLDTFSSLFSHDPLKSDPLLVKGEEDIYSSRSEPETVKYDHVIIM